MSRVVGLFEMTGKGGRCRHTRKRAVVEHNVQNRSVVRGSFEVSLADGEEG
jgi:hypothetical protein